MVVNEFNDCTSHAVRAVGAAQGFNPCEGGPKADFGFFSAYRTAISAWLPPDRPSGKGDRRLNFGPVYR